jgi:hypothetical protein
MRMPFFDSNPKLPRQPTPNWHQVFVLLLGGFLLAAGGCASAFVVFSKAYGGTSHLAVVLWWTLMSVFAVGLLMLVVAVLFMMFMGTRAALRATRGRSSGEGR